MARKVRNTKPLIYVFCEGESEQTYIDYLKNKFEDVAVIKRPKAVGIFDEAQNRFAKDPKFINAKDIIDEIWFFFDVEVKDINSWNSRLRIIKKLRRMRKNPNIRVRLLMTTGCIEYWFMLHYKMFAPPLQSVAEKERMIAQVKNKIPGYFKGDKDTTWQIAKNYKTAVINARKTMLNLLQEGLPGIDDTDERNQWLCRKCLTFSNVYEAIEYLEQLK